MGSPPEQPVRTSDPELDGSRVCVTGGAGFIGTHLTRRLLSLGANVRVIDDLSNTTMGPVAEFLDGTPDHFDFVHASVLDPAALAEAVDGASVVYHLAAISAAGVSLEDPTRVFDVNAAGTQRVAEAARMAGASRLVFAASSSAYGTHPVPHTETMTPDPLSPYAASKLAGEHVVSAYARSMGLPGVSLRFFNVYGPGQPANSAYSAVIPIFVDQVLAGAAPTVHGDGAQTRDFVHVDDVVRALMLAAAAPAGPEPINIGTGQRVSVLDLASRIAELAGRPDLTPVHAAPRAGDVPHSVADVARSRASLGFEAQTPLEDGLRGLIEARRGSAPAPARPRS